MTRRLAALALVIAALAAVRFAARADQTVTLYAGAQLFARMDQPLSSKTVNVGDTFTMTVVPPFPSGDPAFTGAQVQGTVSSVQRAGQGTRPKIGMQLQFLRMADGSVANISGEVTQVTQQSSTANSIGKAALAALGGMLIGNAIGQTIFHTGGGGAAGFIGGALYGANAQENITIPQGSNVAMQLDQAVTVKRQAAPQ
jgi:outer membrane lipoprotein SlyB